MKFGTFLSVQNPDRIAAVVREAEQLDFESIWVPEHLIVPVKSESKYPYSPDGKFPGSLDTPFHDPLLALAYVAAITTRIKLATGVFVLPLRNPFATARAVASLDRLSKGRLIFGIGIGWWAEEFKVVGASFEDRALRTREYLELMKALWSSDDPVYEGKTVSVRDVRFNPKPVQKPHPPIVLGGTTDASLKRAARLGDGWYGVAFSLDETRDLIGRLRNYEKAYPRTQPLEVTISLRTGKLLTLDDVRRMTELGVERALFGLPIAAATDDMLKRFHDDVIARA